MALYRKKGGKVWYASVYVRGAGRTVNKSTGKSDRAEAEEVERLFKSAYNRLLPAERLHALIDALFDGGSGQTAKGTLVSDAYAKYVERLGVIGCEISGKTLTARRRSLRRFVEWRNENRPSCLYASEVTRTVAGEFASAINSSPGIGGKTKRETISDLGTVWNKLMAGDETITENPWRFFCGGRADGKTGTAFSHEQESRILAACKGTEWHTACVVARWTGLRLGDVCRLRWDEIDFDECVIRLSPRKTKRHGITVSIPMSRALVSELSSMTRTVDAVMPELDRTYPHVSRASCGAFSAVLERAGVHGMRFHDWRHTFASRLADAGTSTEIIKKMGGWTQTATALRYQHSERMGELRAAIAAMESQSVEKEPTSDDAKSSP